MDTTKATIAKHAHLTQRRRAVPIHGTAQLTYYISEGVLVGFIGTQMITIEAWSGGGAGSKDVMATKTRLARKAAPHTDDANNPYSTGVAEHGSVRGGPLPTGSYTIGIPTVHRNLGLSAMLTYHSRFRARTGGFAIHGQGPKGSDGCIVIPDAHFRSLMDALKKSGGGHLQVLQAMEDCAFG